MTPDPLFVQVLSYKRYLIYSRICIIAGMTFPETPNDEPAIPGGIPYNATNHLQSYHGQPASLDQDTADEGVLIPDPGHGRVSPSDYRDGLRDGIQLASDNDRLRTENSHLLTQIQALVAERNAYRAAALHWKEQATTDPLTQKPNRLALNYELQEAIEEQPGRVGVFFYDLDGLKEANDGPGGHRAGDNLIKKAIDVLDANVRRSPERQYPDTVGRGAFRLSGDEGVGVVSGIEDASQMEAIRERLVEALQAEGVRASIGYTLHQRDQSAGDLIAAADTAMYRVKQDRREQEQQGLRDALPADVRAGAEELVIRADELGIGVDGLFRLFGKRRR